MKSYKEFATGFEKLFPWFGNLVKGVFLLIFLEAPLELWKAFYGHWKSAKNGSQKVAAVIAGLLVLSFILYGFWGTSKDLNQLRTKQWRKEVLVQNYEIEIRKFFTKYNERFLAHDCDFMAEVGADEAMFDKWGTTKYPDYTCEEFVRYQKKVMTPIKIEPIETTGDKHRVRGEAVVISLNSGEPWKVNAIHFDLWKKTDWDLWHFNPSRKIEIEINN